MNREAFREAESEFVSRHYERLAEKDNHALIDGIEYSVSTVEMPPLHSLSLTTAAANVVLAFLKEHRSSPESEQSGR